MCGITGFVSSDGFDEARLGKACAALAHRGPDDVGTQIWSDHGVGLAQARLSIIDLSAAGHNPMANEDYSIWIVFNGEIYNFESLRAELLKCGHTFRSHTDTEIILHAYEEWGDAHVNRLRGMFAYALYDRRGADSGSSSAPQDPFRLLLVRDRLGIKPLFYSWRAQTLIFGSEIKSILTHPQMDRSRDQSALFDYLTYGYVPAPKTAYKHIRKLPPGQYLVYEGNKLNLCRYWDISFEKVCPARNAAEAAEAVRATLLDATRLHMISDVPLGVFLSGGLDSSTVTALMTRATRAPVNTFSIDFDVAAHSEVEYARLVAKHLHTQHHEHTVGATSVQEMLSRTAQMYDEPFADGSAVPTYQVSAKAREQVKVALSGDGGDEVFAGYKRYSMWLRQRSLDFVPPVMRRTLFPRLNTLYPKGLRGKRFVSGLAADSLEQYAGLVEWFTPFQKRQLLDAEWASEFADYDDYWYFRQYWRADIDPLTRVQYLDLKTYLPDDILTKVDRASMAVALEVRPPLLDHELVELAFSIPAKVRAPKGEKKYLLKRVAQEWLPNQTLTRAKKGFSAPWQNWMGTHQAWAKERLSADTGTFRQEMTARPWLLSNGNKTWALLVLQQWLCNEGSAINEGTLSG